MTIGESVYIKCTALSPSPHGNSTNMNSLSILSTVSKVGKLGLHGKKKWGVRQKHIVT